MLAYAYLRITIREVMPMVQYMIGLCMAVKLEVVVQIRIVVQMLPA